MPTAHPTIVLGVGDTLLPLLQQVERRARLIEPGLASILRIGAVVDGQLHDSAGVRVQGQDEALEGQLAVWLREVLDADHLAEAAAAGLEIAAGAQGMMLVARILLVIDGDTAEAELLAALRALRSTTERGGLALPARLAGVALATGEGRGVLPFPLPEHLQAEAGQRLLPTNVVVLDSWRSDSSSVSEEALRQALPLLLVLALLPAEGSASWLFRVPRGTDAEPSPSLPCTTFGLGLLTVPLPDILEALSAALGADLLERVLQPLAPTESAETFFRGANLTDNLEEAAVWSSLFHDLPCDAKKLDHGEFVVRLHEGQLALELSRVDWARWADAITDYELRWGLAHEERWKRALEARAGEQLGAARAVLEGMLDRAVQHGASALALAREAVEQYGAHLDERWRCQNERDRSISDPALRAARDQLTQALQAVPSPAALAARSALMLSAEALYGWALALVLLARGADVGVAAGAGVTAGLVLAIPTVLVALAQGRDGRRRVDAARDALMAAARRRYEETLRLDGLALLQRIRESLRETLQQTSERIDAIEAALQERREQLSAQAASFDPTDSTMVRTVVASWSELSPVADDVWRRRQDQPQLAAELLKEAQLHTFARLARLVEAHATVRRRDETAPPAQILDLLRAARAVLARLGEQHLSRLGYYLEQRFPEHQEREAWLRETLAGLAGQGRAVLWTREHLVGELRTWQVLPSDEPALAGAAGDVASQQAHGDLHVPALLGWVSEQEVQS